jgi:threonine dehydrogenase-like Zn-dependent dehydrogenase
MRTYVLYGRQGIRLEEREMPRPQAGQVLIRFGYGGICGSDMHYYVKGANGDFVVKHPFGRIDITPLITHQFGFDRVADAFTVAADGRQSAKVQLFFPPA